MQRLRASISNNLEKIAIALGLIIISITGFFIPNKLLFLNLYFLPIIAAGYVVGKRFALIWSLITIAGVLLYAFLLPDHFLSSPNPIDIKFKIMIWGAFLIFVGIIIGNMNEKLREELQESRRLNTELRQQKEELYLANSKIKNINENMEDKVKDRTDELERTNKTFKSANKRMRDALYATMDYEIVEQIIKGKLRNEKRQISILFSDLTDFTTYSDEKRPEVVIEELNRFLGAMEPIVMQYHGHIDKYIGDGIMCEFGAPTDYPTHPLQSVLAGLKMQERLAELNLPWQMRIGISTGMAITGIIGTKRQSYTAIGDVVNLAARLQSICPPGKILIDEDTYQGVARYVDAEKVRSFSAQKKELLEFEKKVHECQERLSLNPNDVACLFDLGNAYYQLGQITEAIECFERILIIEPENVEAKLMYAEANINKDKFEKIEVKGKKSRISVYEVTGLKDVLQDPAKIPASLYAAYRDNDTFHDLPQEMILPVEALDGRVGHARVVSFLAYAIADRLGLEEQEKQDIMMAACLSDIEMGSVSHHLLNRSGRLTELELKEIEKHPLQATRVIKELGYNRDIVLDSVLHHHEMYNGRGYPFGKKGDDIPIGARIIAVADAYDALTSWRPYREPWERQAALAEIERCVDRGNFDPKIVHTLMELVN